MDQTQGHRNKIYRHILQQIHKKLPGALLDVGAGCGYFLAAARTKGWEIKGIEPSIESIEHAKKELGITLFNGTLKTYSNSNGLFDVVTFVNVLEHSSEPWNEIKKAAELLRTNGIIFIRFPNSSLHALILKMASSIKLQDKINRFLVFHEFPLTKPFVTTLLSDSGFSNISLTVSPLTSGDPNRLSGIPIIIQLLKTVVYYLTLAIQILSRNKWLLGPSLEVIAIKDAEEKSTGTNKH
jgi:SAM-dependent methyltransferase